MVKTKPTAKKKSPAKKTLGKEAPLRVIDVPAIPPDVSKWPTEVKTAELLGVSVRTVRRMATEGKLGRSRRKVIAGRRPYAVYNPADIARAKAEQQMGGSQLMKVAGSHSQPSSLALVERVVGTTVKEAVREAVRETVSEVVASVIEVMDRVVDKKLAAAPETSQEPLKLFLTIGEGAKVSGLSKAYLRREVQSGRLPSVRDGRSTKLRRTDLEFLGAASAERVKQAGG
jgi:excisionase family DNA binding protein